MDFSLVIIHHVREQKLSLLDACFYIFTLHVHMSFQSSDSACRFMYVTHEK